MKTEDLNNINMLHMLDQMLAEIRTSAEMKYDQLQETNLELRKEITKLQAECKELQKTTTEMKNQLEEMQTNLEVLRRDLNQISYTIEQRLNEFLKEQRSILKEISTKFQTCYKYLSNLF